MLLTLLQNLRAPTVLAPVVLASPQNQSVLQGQTATFTVIATGTALTYQWLRGGNPITGAILSSYTTSATGVSSDNGAQFSCIVKNAGGAVTSAAALLTVVSAQFVIPQPLNPAGPVGICNLALSMLGSAGITSLTDPSNAARVMNLEYALIRDAELGAHRWRFAIRRTTLSALTAAPASGPFKLAYPLPADYIDVLEVGDFYPGVDLTDYRSMPTTEGWAIEGGLLLTNLPAPLAFKYKAQISDTSRFHPCFTTALAAMLAWKCCERITQAAGKRQLAMSEYKEAITAAIRANALELIPETAQDDTWVMARLQ